MHRAEALFAILCMVYTIWNKYPPEPEIEVTDESDFKRYDGRFNLIRGSD